MQHSQSLACLTVERGLAFGARTEPVATTAPQLAAACGTSSPTKPPATLVVVTCRGILCINLYTFFFNCWKKQLSLSLLTAVVRCSNPTSRSSGTVDAWTYVRGLWLRDADEPGRRAWPRKHAGAVHGWLVCNWIQGTKTGTEEGQGFFFPALIIIISLILPLLL